MAGGKETPRQKMISLMYLVLLALLALQVSKEILVKFQQLNDSLEVFVEESREKSHALLANISDKVEERGKKPKEVETLDDARLLNERSEKLIKYIEDIKQELIAETDGKDDETGNYKGAKNEDVPSRLMIGEGDKKDGHAYELYDRLNDYVKFLNDIYVKVDEATGGDGSDKQRYKPLAYHGKDHPQLKNTEGAKNKDFANLNFNHTPMIACLAFLTEKQSKIAAYEGDILAKVQESVGASDFKFDKLKVMASAKSNVVAAGTYYEADMFVTAFSSTADPQMTYNGKEIDVQNGIGEVKFKTSIKGGKKNKDGLYEKSYNAEIKMKDPLGGEDKVFEEKITYFVSKPVIQVQSASVQALYKNCGNELSVQVPALGAEYNPSFSVNSGNKLRKGSKKGEVVIIPSTPKVSLTVRSGGQTIGTEKFQVQLIPKPDIKAFAGNKEVDQKRGMTAPGPRSITMKAIPDQSFANFLPKDARYKVNKWTAMLVRGKRPVKTQDFSSQTGNMSQFASQAKPGDRILIEVKEVLRLNFLDQVENVDVGTVIMNIPLND